MKVKFEKIKKENKNIQQSNKILEEQKKVLTEVDKKLLNVVKNKLLSKGAKTFMMLKQERKRNNDYFKELEFLRVEGTTEKRMPILS